MKKVITSVLALMLIISSLMVGSFAAYDYEDTFDMDLSSSYDSYAGNGAIIMHYKPGGWFTNVRASTDVSVSNDATGYAFTFIKALNSDIASISSSEKDGNIVNSGEASVSGQDYAEMVNHLGTRTINERKTSWNYYCE